VSANASNDVAYFVIFQGANVLVDNKGCFDSLLSVLSLMACFDLSSKWAVEFFFKRVLDPFHCILA